MNAWIDANVWTGQFPFRRIANTTVEEIERRFDALGFGGGVVSPLEAIFQEDSYGAEEALHAEIAARPGLLKHMWHFKVVNPACNWWKRDLRKAVEVLNISGIRLCPTFHGYRLDDVVVAEVMETAATLRLPVQVLCKMQDWRIEWMLHTTDVEADQVDPFLQQFDDHRIILSGLHVSDMKRIDETVSKCPNALLDTSRLKGPWKTFESLCAAIDSSKICFGSLWPINLPECPLSQLENEEMETGTKEAILGGNIARMLQSANGEAGGDQ